MTNVSKSSGSSLRGIKAALSAARKDPKEVNNLLDLCRPLLTLMARQSMDYSFRRREGDSDIVQMTILEAIKDFARFQGRTAQEFFAWLRQLHRRNIQNRIRYHRAGKRDVRRDKQLRMSDESGVSLSWYVTAGKPDSPSMMIANAENALALAAAVERLPEAQRTAITMRHIDGATLAEICTAMERSPASVAGLLRRGLQALRQELGSETSWS